MPIRSRKFYIELHNRGVEDRKENLERQQGGKRTMSADAWLDQFE